MLRLQSIQSVGRHHKKALNSWSFACEIRSTCGHFSYVHCLKDRKGSQLYCNTISLKDKCSSSCWCLLHEQKATKVSGTHFDDKAGSAKCVFTAIAPGCGLEWRNVGKKDGGLCYNPREPYQTKLICWMTALLLLVLPLTLTSTLLPSHFTLALAQWQAPQLSSPIDRCWLQLPWII